MQFFVQTYRAVCILCAIGLGCWCVYQYKLDKDVTEVTFRRFHTTKDDIYPSVTFCLTKPFVSSKLKKIDESLTIKKYQSNV